MRPLSPLALVLALGLVAGPALAQSVSLPKTQYAPGEAIVVRVTGVTSTSDWVTVVPRSNAAEDYGQWDWAPEAGGSMSFDGQRPGSYEVRAYCCWSSSVGGGGYRVVSRAPFTVAVGGASGGQRVSLEVPARVGAGQRITVGYSAEPAHETDWVAIAAVGAADDSYVRWDYTGGYTDGVETFDGLAAGRYEARFYCCWSETSSYAVIARRAFVVE